MLDYPYERSIDDAAERGTGIPKRQEVQQGARSLVHCAMAGWDLRPLTLSHGLPAIAVSYSDRPVVAIKQ